MAVRRKRGGLAFTPATPTVPAIQGRRRRTSIGDTSRSGSIVRPTRVARTFRITERVYEQGFTNPNRGTVRSCTARQVSLPFPF